MKEIHRTSFNALYAHFQDQRSRQHALVLCRLVRHANVDVSSAIREHVLGDDWFDFAARSLREYFVRTHGYVYLAATHDHPGLIKLGKTSRRPQQRIQDLSRENVLHSFRLLHAMPVHDRHWVELCSHRLLQRQGVARIKEFFAADCEQMRTCIGAAVTADQQLFIKQGWAGALEDEASI